MTSNDLHEITFFWPRTDANRVIVTGTFDNWSRSLQLVRTSTGFTTSVKVPWSSRVAYKYLVDGKWMLDETKPRMIEPEGYVNNVYVVPSKPSRPTSESTGAPNGDSDASVLEKVLNGHATLDKKQPSQPEAGAYDSSIAKAMMSIPVDRQHPVVEMAVGQDVAPKAVEKTVEEKREDGASNSGSPPSNQTAELSAQGAEKEPGAQTEGTTTKAEGEMSQTTPPSPGGSKRPIRMPLVPVNVPCEGTANGHPQSGDQTASTHNPLGLVNKPRSASAASESIPVTSPVPRELEQPESKIPAASGAEGNGVAPPLSGEEPEVPAPPQEVVAPKEEHAVPQNLDAEKAAQPTREEKPTESAALSKPVNGKEPNGTPSRPSDTSGSSKARFPRVSRESSESRPKLLPNGSPRKQRVSFLQKIKHIFAHDKGKK